MIETRSILARLRLTTGLVMFAYLMTHFLNHALGLVSLAVLEQGRTLFLALWRNPVGTLLLYGALVTHLGLAFWSIYQPPQPAHVDLAGGAAGRRADDPAASRHPHHRHSSRL